MKQTEFEKQDREVIDLVNRGGPTVVADEGEQIPEGELLQEGKKSIQEDWEVRRQEMVRSIRREKRKQAGVLTLGVLGCGAYAAVMLAMLLLPQIVDLMAIIGIGGAACVAAVKIDRYRRCWG